MASNPSSVFYWNDWVLDPALRLCSMAARGFWMEMLAIAAAATPHGYVRVGNKPCTISGLAQITGQDRRSVSRWVRELEQNGVFSRDDLGIFCRRMVHESEQQNQRGRPKKIRKKSPPLESRDSVTVGDPQDSFPFISKSDSESVAEREGEKNEKVNPDARCAGLSGAGAPPLESPPAKVLKANAGRVGAGTCDRSFDGQTSEVPATIEPPRPSEVNPPIIETPARAVLVGANRGGTSDGETSLPSPVADNTRLGLADQGRAYPLTGSASSPSIRLGAFHGRCRKTPALRARIKEQLRAKHVRFLQARKRQEEFSAYWAAMLGDDPAEAQRMFDETDRRMRAAGWDDMRQWKRRHGVAA